MISTSVRSQSASCYDPQRTRWPTTKCSNTPRRNRSGTTSQDGSITSILMCMKEIEKQISDQRVHSWHGSFSATWCWQLSSAIPSVRKMKHGRPVIFAVVIADMADLLRRGQSMRKLIGTRVKEVQEICAKLIPIGWAAKSGQSAEFLQWIEQFNSENLAEIVQLLNNPEFKVFAHPPKVLSQYPDRLLCRSRELDSVDQLRS